jgi:integrase
MPRKTKGPRLYFRKAKGTRKAVYVIRDGQREFSTGTTDSRSAEKALRDYIIEKERPIAPGAAFMVMDALRVYAEKRADKIHDPARIGYAISALGLWWRDRSVDEVNDDTCEKYAKDRRSGYIPKGEIDETRPVQNGTIRRELGCLRSALICCHTHGLISSVPVVTLPNAPPPKERWLTRDEVASLIRAARQDPRTRYLARFILCALYTGSRKTVVLTARFSQHSTGGHVDLKRGLFFRKANGQDDTKKSAPTIHLPSRLRRHLERWNANGARWLVELDGHGVANIKNDWEAIRKRAGLPDVTPHTLRHTAITWAMQSGANVWHISGYFGVSLDTLEKVYAHHHPNHMKSAVAAANRMGKMAA